MRKEDLVYDIEYAKKLKELGFKQDSIFSYVRRAIIYGYNTIDSLFEEEYTLVDDEFLINGVYTDRISAFTTDELLEMLPSNTRVRKYESGYEVYYCFLLTGHSECIKDDKLPNALAQLLIWCIENKL